MAIDAAQQATLEQLLLHFDIESFLYKEAELLDERRFDEWLDLFTDDLVYVAPVRAVLRARKDDVVDDSTLFEDNKRSMGLRVVEN